MIAHIRKSDKAAQTLKEHCNHVAMLCERAARPLGLSKTAFFIGLLHDMGKATKEFSEYLTQAAEGLAVSSPHYHSPAGAIFVYRRYFCEEKAGSFRRAAAQIVSLCICGHHAGLSDCLNEHMTSDFLENMRLGGSVHYDESSSWFFENILSSEELDRLFAEVQEEITFFIANKIKAPNDAKSSAFRLGMLTRLLLSILVDADRWDSACFEYGADFSIEQSEPDWDNLFERFEKFRTHELNAVGEIGKIRSDISNMCLSKAEKSGGIYTLCVPTGGGKTYSSLRYALRHCASHKKKKIFYIIPYNTILDQNAQDIRKALSDYPSILEHHSNVVMSTQQEQEDYLKLTERWDSDIILTSLVQFLNACFSSSNTDARRFYRLTEAVLIFDEIQSLPKKCKTLFEQAITFLSVCCGSTVVLCTATQPELELSEKPTELIDSRDAVFEKMKRVSYIPQLEKALHNDEAALKLTELLKRQSVLTIVNTKAVARDVFFEVIGKLSEAGITPLTADFNLSEAEIVRRARESTENEALCVHMSTLLCPAHRKLLIRQIKLWLKEKARVFCVSTALIEAGINVSFPVVVRSLTGLPSIVQAAGRANRSMEYETGSVYVWNFCDEKLNSLEDIQNGGNITRSILSSKSFEALDSPEIISLYFQREQDYTNSQKDYPIKKDYPFKIDSSLYKLLSDNKFNAQKAAMFKQNSGLILKQSFRTACREFKVIDQNTKTVIVPFGRGKELIAKLEGENSMAELHFLLKAAQAYSVSLPESVFKRLSDSKAIYPAGDTGVYCLESGYYDENSGVTTERGELELMVY